MRRFHPSHPLGTALPVLALLLSGAGPGARAQTSLPGWPVDLFGPVSSAPAVADLDGDGDLELIVADVYNTVHAYHHYGQVVTGWPIGLGDTFASVALADLDGDGKPWVVVPVRWWSPVQGPQIHVFDGAASPRPGWPVTVEGPWIMVPPTVVDLDRDGTLNILAAASGNQHAFRPDGSVLPGWPAPLAQPYLIPMAATVVADVNRDGSPEVFAASEAAGSEPARVYGWTAGGTPLPGFPVELADELRGDMAAVDLDGDGRHEIAFTTRDSLTYVLRGDGTVLPGWPRAVHRAGIFTARGGVSAGDLDGDGHPELAAAARDEAYLWNADGTSKPGWPVALDNPPPIGAGVNSAPLIADVDGDGLADLIVLNSDNRTTRVHALRFDGSSVPGYPFSFEGEVQANSATLADLDQNGTLDLLVGARGFHDIHVIDLGAPYDPATLEWPTHGHDYQRTFRYEPLSPPPGHVDDTHRLDPVLGPDPFPVVDTGDITEAATQQTVCDFACAGGPEACCGPGVAGGDPALIFTVRLIGDEPAPRLVDAEYEVYLDYGEEGLRGFTEEPGLVSKDPKKGTADVTLKLDLKEKKKTKKGGRKQKSPFKGLDGIEFLSAVDQTNGIIDFVIPVAALQKKANLEQAAASGFDRFPEEPATILLWFRTKTKADAALGPESMTALVDRARNTDDNLAPTVVSEALDFVVDGRDAISDPIRVEYDAQPGPLDFRGSDACPGGDTDRFVLGDGDSLPLRLVNVSPFPVTVTGVEFPDPAFAVIADFPITLSPDLGGEAVEVVVDFAPTGPWFHTPTGRVLTDSGPPVEFQALGRGFPNERPQVGGCLIDPYAVTVGEGVHILVGVFDSATVANVTTCRVIAQAYNPYRTVELELTDESSGHPEDDDCDNVFSTFTIAGDALGPGSWGFRFECEDKQGNVGALIYHYCSLRIEEP